MMLKTLFPVALAALTVAATTAQGISAGVNFRLQNDSIECGDDDQATLLDITVDSLAAAGLSLNNGDWSTNRGRFLKAVGEEDSEVRELTLEAAPHRRRLCGGTCYDLCQLGLSYYCQCCQCCDSGRRERTLNLRGLQRTTDATLDQIARNSEVEAVKLLKELPTAPSCLDQAFDVIVNLHEDSPDRTEDPFV